MDPMLEEYLLRLNRKTIGTQGPPSMMVPMVPSYRPIPPPTGEAPIGLEMDPRLQGVFAQPETGQVFQQPMTPETPVTPIQDIPASAPQAPPPSVGAASPEAFQSGSDVGYMAAQLGQRLAEAGQGMSTTAGQILLKYQPPQTPQYVKEYLMKKEEERAGRKEEREVRGEALGEKLALTREQRAQAEEQRAKEQEEFQRELRAQARAKMAVDEQMRVEASDPNSGTSKARRTTIEAVYKDVRKLLPNFDELSAEQLDRTMPAPILKTIQDHEEAKLRMEEASANRDRLHTEKMAILDEQKTKAEQARDERRRARGLISESAAKEFGEVNKVFTRITDIEKLWKETIESTGPLEGRIRKGLQRLGVGERTAELSSELGKAFADYVKQISGAAVSEEEFQRLALNMPQLKDDKERFAFLLNSWKRDQIRTLSSLALREANREVDNVFLKDNVEAQLRSIDPRKHLIRDTRGFWTVADDQEHPEVVAKAKEAEVIDLSMAKARDIAKDAITKDDKGSEIVNMIVLEGWGRKMKQSNPTPVRLEFIAKKIRDGEKVLQSGAYIVIDRRGPVPTEIEGPVKSRNNTPFAHGGTIMGAW